MLGDIERARSLLRDGLLAAREIGLTWAFIGGFVGLGAAYARDDPARAAIRANMSTFALLDGRLVADGVARLARDLTDRSWHSRYASLLTLPELDAGYRLVVAELG
jgi:hypothetical protein